MDEHLLILLFCSDLVVLHFSAAWAPQCKQMNDVMEELSKDSQYANVKFAQVTNCLLLCKLDFEKSFLQGHTLYATF